MFLPGKSGPGF